MTTRFARKMKAKRLKTKLIQKDLVDRWKILRGDTVQIISGKDAGKQGVVKKVLRGKNRLVVSGCNLTKRHVKRSKERAGFVFTKESPLHMSNVMLLDPIDGKPTRVRWKFEEQQPDTTAAAADAGETASTTTTTIAAAGTPTTEQGDSAAEGEQIKFEAPKKVKKRKLRVSKRTNAEIPRPDVSKRRRPRPSNPLKDTLPDHATAPTFLLAEIEVLKNKKLHILETRYLNHLKQLHFNRIKYIGDRRRKQEEFEKAVFEKSKEITATRNQNALLAAAMANLQKQSSTVTKS